mgnify:CR=1 FL=1
MDTKALRQKILDLAIRGKLVPQDPNDEPAEVLLERIREQKQQMLKEGKLKKKDIKNDTIIFKGEDNLHYEKFQDGTVKCIEDEIPFEVPEGWEWCRLPIITTDIFAGGDKPDICEKRATEICNIPIYSNGIENDGLYGYTNKPRVTEPSITISARGTIGFCCARKTPFVPIVRLITITPSKEISLYYLKTVFKALIETGEGSSIPQLTVPGIKLKLIPIPPIMEQDRIQSKQDEILKYISDISFEKDKLRRIVQQAKNKILDLAIHGKLVPQDPNDEPASVLLERIRAEKEELIKQGKIKRDKKESVIFKGDDNSYYGIHLPDSWNWASLREIALSISDGSHNPPPNNGSGIPLLSAANINDNSILMNEISRWITNEEWKIENQRTNIEVGDVLLTIVGSIGRSAVVQNNNHFALQRSVAVIKPCLINPLYLMHIVQSPQIQKWLTDNSKGTAQKGIYLNALSLMIIPIPPLAEQARIVELIHIAYKQLDLISNALL